MGYIASFVLRQPCCPLFLSAMSFQQPVNGYYSYTAMLFLWSDRSRGPEALRPTLTDSMLLSVDVRDYYLPVIPSYAYVSLRLNKQ